MRVLNSVLRRLLGTPLSSRCRFASAAFRRAQIGASVLDSVSAHVVDGTLYALANAGWKVNFRGGAPAGGSRQELTAMYGELIEDPDVIADLCHRTAMS